MRMDLADVLDDGAGELSRLMAALGLALLVALLTAVAVPLLLLSALLPHPPAVGPLPPPAASMGSGSSADAPAGVVEVARGYLGVRYLFGGTDPAVGLDCSGLVQLVYRRLGVALPRTAQQQFEATTRVSTDQLQPGDLVFFARTYDDPHDWITHVGIYVGDQMQINAPTTGQVVSIQPVFSGFWGAHYAGAGRVRRS